MVIYQECLFDLDELVSTKFGTMSRLPDNPLIHDDHQKGMCCVVSGKVPNDLLIHDNH